MLLITTTTAIAVIISLFFDYKKTIAGIKKGLKMFLGISIPLFNILILVSVALYLMPKETIVSLLGKNSGILGISISALIGSILLIPSFIAYPLASVLIKSGMGYSSAAVFITTLMMVGVLTLPLEAKYFGLRVSIIRNVLSFIGAIIIGVLIGFVI